MNYEALYTEWTVNESDERILRKSAESKGTFKIPPNPVFKERHKKLKKDKFDKLYDRLPSCREDYSDFITLISDISAHHTEWHEAA